MAELVDISRFAAYLFADPSANLTHTGFERFDPFSISIFHATIYASVKLNHENLIFKGFENPAVETSNNPY